MLIPVIDNLISANKLYITVIILNYHVIKYIIPV